MPVVQGPALTITAVISASTPGPLGFYSRPPAEDPWDLTFREQGQGGSTVTQAVGPRHPPMLADKQGLHPLEFSLRAEAKQSLVLLIPLLLCTAAVSSGAEASCVPECRPEDPPQGIAGPTESLGIGDHTGTASKDGPLFRADL